MSEIFRQRCIRFDIFSGPWMYETERFGVKALPLKAEPAA